MEYRFTILIEGLGELEVAAEAGEAMINAFEEREPKAAAAVGANLNDGVLEVSFSVDGASPDSAWERANSVFLSAANASGLAPHPIVAVDFEPILGPAPALPLRRRGRGAEAWSLPSLARA